jgi:hypothetical protein
MDKTLVLLIPRDFLDFHWFWNYQFNLVKLRFKFYCGGKDDGMKFGGSLNFEWSEEG